MSDDKERELIHQSNLVQWEKMFDSALHADRMAGEIGVFVIKTLIVVNAGALVALIAAYPALLGVKKFAAALPDAGAAFLWGLLASMLAVAVAYFYQSFMAANEWTQMQERFPIESEPPQYRWAKTSSRVAIIICIALLIWSFGQFIYGADTMLTAFNATAKPTG